jgi:hypothetical protein
MAGTHADLTADEKAVKVAESARTARRGRLWIETIMDLFK